MEGANESARNAVNGLFDAKYNREDRCEVFDPRENEPKALKLLQEMDDYRFKQGLPWGGVSLGDWIVRAGWAADAVGDVILADDKGDTSLVPIARNNDFESIAAPPGEPQPVPYRHPPGNGIGCCRRDEREGTPLWPGKKRWPTRLHTLSR